MTTTDDLRALLPAEPNGWPTEPGWYVAEVDDGDTLVDLFTRSLVEPGRMLLQGSDSESSPGLIVRHAPLRLEAGETAQALVALHLAGFEGGILDAVGAALAKFERSEQWWFREVNNVRGRELANADEAAALRARVAELCGPNAATVLDVLRAENDALRDRVAELTAFIAGKSHGVDT